MAISQKPESLDVHLWEQCDAFVSLLKAVYEHGTKGRRACAKLLLVEMEGMLMIPCWNGDWRIAAGHGGLELCSVICAGKCTTES